MFRIVKGGGIKLDFSSTRCGEFPGFQQMRTMFTSYFWKEFVARGAELRYNCKANTKVDLKFKIIRSRLKRTIRLYFFCDIYVDGRKAVN